MAENGEVKFKKSAHVLLDVLVPKEDLNRVGPLPKVTVTIPGWRGGSLASSLVEGS